MQLKNSHVLVTGGAGFIGSSLCQRLAELGASVVILDNLSTGFLENIHDLNRRFEGQLNFIQGDVRDYDVCLKATSHVELVFHQAGQINPVRAVEDPMFDMEVNCGGTLNLLRACEVNGVRKFILASTNVYGNPKYLPIDENHPIDLLSPYAASKLAAEAYCMVYHNTYDVKTVRLRYSNVYGPRQRSEKTESGVIPIFISRILRREAPVVFGDGKQSRDFIYVTDVVEANLKAALADLDDPEVFNIGSGQEITIKHFANLLLRMSDCRELTPLFVEPRKADFKRCKIDYGKAQKLLGWQPTVGFEEGIKKTFEWWRQVTSAE